MILLSYVTLYNKDFGDQKWLNMIFDRAEDFPKCRRSVWSFRPIYIAYKIMHTSTKWSKIFLLYMKPEWECRTGSFWLFRCIQFLVQTKQQKKTKVSTAYNLLNMYSKRHTLSDELTSIYEYTYTNLVEYKQWVFI